MYTLWTHGELLGESALDYVRVIPELRTGDLRPTEKGLIVFERLAQIREDCYRSALRVNKRGSEAACDESELQTLYADLAAQRDRYDALALELRASDGSVIPTDSIHVTDTHYLLAIDRERHAKDDALEEVEPEPDLDPEVLAALQEELKEFEEDHPPWMAEAPEREPARFQLAVVLSDEWAIP